MTPERTLHAAWEKLSPLAGPLENNYTYLQCDLSVTIKFHLLMILMHVVTQAYLKLGYV